MQSVLWWLLQVVKRLRQQHEHVKFALPPPVLSTEFTAARASEARISFTRDIASAAAARSSANATNAARTLAPRA